MRVYTANPYQPGQLGSMGSGEYLLIRQHKFPDTYEEGEHHLLADSDRLFQWDHDHANRCFKEHTGTGSMGLEQWIRSASADNVLKFLVDILKANTVAGGGGWPPTQWERLLADEADLPKWTGFRVMGTVHRGTGYVVWTLEVFAKNRGSKTKVYSSERAPNIKDGGIQFHGIHLYDQR